jgi:hypothetical protein
MQIEEIARCSLMKGLPPAGFVGLFSCSLTVTSECLRLFSFAFFAASREQGYFRHLAPNSDHQGRL